MSIEDVSFVIVVGIGVDQGGVAVLQYVAYQALSVFLPLFVALTELFVVV